MGRAPSCERLGVKKGPWTPEDDIILVSYIQDHGPGNWRSVPTNTGLLRCSKSCRLRWTNYLRPGIRRGDFTSQEEKMIIHLQALLGNRQLRRSCWMIYKTSIAVAEDCARWAAIASYLPQRTDNDIKNYWNSHLKKKLRKTQSGTEKNSHGENSSLTSPSHQKTPKGQWERTLQTDIHMAKQALCEALSLAKPIFEAKETPQASYNPNKILLAPPPTSPSKTLQATQAPTSYASSADNIARLLENWSKKKSSSESVGQNYSCKAQQQHGRSRTSDGELSSTTHDHFDSIFDSSHGTFHQDDTLLFLEESVPLSMEVIQPLTLLEKWLFFDDGGDDVTRQG